MRKTTRNRAGMARGKEKRRQGPEMGYRGSLYQGRFSPVEELIVLPATARDMEPSQRERTRCATLGRRGDLQMFPGEKLLVDVNVLHDWLGRIPRCGAR